MKTTELADRMKPFIQRWIDDAIGHSGIRATSASGAPTDASYVVISNNATLTAERAVSQGNGIALTDGGANSTLGIAVDQTYPFTWTGSHLFSGNDLRLDGDLDFVGTQKITTTTGCLVFAIAGSIMDSNALISLVGVAPIDFLRFSVFSDQTQGYRMRMTTSATCPDFSIIPYEDGGYNFNSEFSYNRSASTWFADNRLSVNVTNDGDDMDGVFHVMEGTGAGAVAANTLADTGVFEANVTGGISILTPQTACANIFFGDAADNDAGQIGYEHSRGFRFRVEDPSACAFMSVSSLDFGQATALTTITGNMSVCPAGDFIFDPTGNDILPNTSYDLNIGSLQKKYLTLHAAELWVETLVAQETIATIGGRIIVAPTTVLTASAASSVSLINVKHNQMQNGDIALIAASARVEFLQMTSNATPASQTGASGYEYSVTRDLDGTGANDWYAGDAVINTGTTGTGFMDLYALEGINAPRFEHIYIDDNGSFSANQADSSYFDLFPTTGSLQDALYLGLENAKWENAYFNVVTAGNFGNASAWEYWSGSTWDDVKGASSIPNLEATGEQKLQFAASNQSAWATTSVNSVTAYWVRCRISSGGIWTQTPIQGGRHVRRGPAPQFGPTIVGNIRNSATFNDWSEFWSIGNLNGLYGYGVDTYGIGLGKYAAGANHITIDNASGLQIYNGLTAVVGRWDTSGSIQVGQFTSGCGNVAITASAIELRRGSTPVIRMETDGDFSLGTDLTIAGSTYISIFANAQTYNSESMGAGDMLIGDNSISQANILYDASASKLLFRGGTASAAGINTKGEIEAGRGAVILNASGMSILGETQDIFSPCSGIIFYRGGPIYTASDAARIYGYRDTSLLAKGINITVPGETGIDSTILIAACGNNSNNPGISIVAEDGSAASTLLQILDNGIFVTDHGLWLGDTGGGGFTPQAGTIYLNYNQVNANMTKGITISQITNNDEILSLKSNNVSHGITTVTEGDTYGSFLKQSSNDGGLLIRGFTDDATTASGAITLLGYLGKAYETAVNTGVRGGIRLRATEKSGTTASTPGGNAALVTIEAGGTTRFVFQADGDLHADAGLSASSFDTHDDLQLVRALSKEISGSTLVKTRFDEMIRYNRRDLETLGIVSPDEPDGAFVNWTQVWRLTLGATWQLSQKIYALEEAVKRLGIDPEKIYDY